MALTLGPSVHSSLRVPILCNQELQQFSLSNVKTLHNECMHIEDVHFIYSSNWNNKTRTDVQISSMFDITCRRMYLVSVSSMLLIFCSCLGRVFFLFTCLSSFFDLYLMFDVTWLPFTVTASFHSPLFKLCTSIAHKLNMCTSYHLGKIVAS